VRRRHALVVVLLALAAALAGAGIHVSSRAPDGLERVRVDLGLPGRDASAAAARATAAPVAGDHAVTPDRLRRSAAAVGGTLVALAACVGLARLLARRRAVPAPPAAGARSEETARWPAPEAAAPPDR
jgi:hypothetical protein